MRLQKNNQRANKNIKLGVLAQNKGELKILDLHDRLVVGVVVESDAQLANVDCHVQVQCAQVFGGMRVLSTGQEHDLLRQRTLLLDDDVLVLCFVFCEKIRKCQVRQEGKQTAGLDSTRQSLPGVP